MDKLKLHSLDLGNEKLEKLAELFPNCITEVRDDRGQPKRSIDFDLLRQELSGNLVEGPQERYHLNWPGKRDSLAAANAQIAKTLRPVRDESIAFDTTKNLFLEGDNLDGLKMLLEPYLGKVRMVYIDPPYNTGSDFVYDDDYADDVHAYLIRSNQRDDAGNKLVLNSESEGRFHSDWLSLMYPRLRLARQLLRDDGVIFISIDHCELATLLLLCDEVFGRDNRIGVISRTTGTRMGEGSRGIARELDYLLAYSRTPEVDLQGLPMSREEMSIYDQEDEHGKYLTRSLRRTGGENRREDRPTMYYAVKSPEGDDIYPIAPEGYESRWVCGKDTYEQLVKDELIEWKKVTKGSASKWQVYQKHYLKDALRHPSDLWPDEEGNKKATRDLNTLFDGRKVFNHPKPIGLIQKLLLLGTSPTDESIVLDFFAGSGTTGHAVMAQNALDGGNRRFILIQIAEPLSPDNKAQQVAAQVCEEIGVPKTVAELTKERLRRAGQAVFSVCADPQFSLDIGFRVLKIDSSNMKDVYYQPDNVVQADLLGFVDNVREDRTSEDLLFQVLLDWGVDLTLPVEKATVQGKTVYYVDGNAVAACFEEGIDEAFVKAIATRKPLRAVFRDSTFESDSMKINAEQIFKLLSPGTELKAI